MDSAIIGFPNTYPLDSNFSVGYCYPTFEQLGPDLIINDLFLINKDKSGKLEENLADDQSHLGVKLIALKVKYVGL